MPWRWIAVLMQIFDAELTNYCVKKLTKTEVCLRHFSRRIRLLVRLSDGKITSKLKISGAIRAGWQAGLSQHWLRGAVSKSLQVYLVVYNNLWLADVTPVHNLVEVPVEAQRQRIMYMYMKTPIPTFRCLLAIYIVYSQDRSTYFPAAE